MFVLVDKPYYRTEQVFGIPAFRKEFMKIFTFQGGLGNQLFEYAYYLYLAKKYPNENIYGFYPSIAMNQHYGLEINKWFDVQLPKDSFITNTLGYMLFRINRWLLFRKQKGVLCNCDETPNESNPYVYGFWQDCKYISQVELPSFRKDLVINDSNKSLLKLLKEDNSVAVHVRRGDYTLQHVQRIYGGICTPAYYKAAIKRASEDIKNPRFFFFSDEPDYIEENFGYIKDKVIVSNNRGEDSFFDMYLMAHARNLILANSTFSCWAAYLNDSVKNIYCPNRWTNVEPIPNLIKEGWKIIE